MEFLLNYFSKEELDLITANLNDSERHNVESNSSNLCELLDYLIELGVSSNKLFYIFIGNLSLLFSSPEEIGQKIIFLKNIGVDNYKDLLAMPCGPFNMSTKEIEETLYKTCPYNSSYDQFIEVHIKDLLMLREEPECFEFEETTDEHEEIIKLRLELKAKQRELEFAEQKLKDIIEVLDHK